ncbi:MAG: GGDEF domain-containing protein [Sulfurimonas sp.]|uniref:GGDEF domain-containing protein n=1 Tax=Sulfurimonas sp. TaxID=2022749 RepID=UPI00262E833B|nr:GGDEF domain-containing protein [Sulfurimonas sp.]MDD5401503.1 GGDEF domain-containing protein [Sulfurimonas sp.]
MIFQDINKNKKNKNFAYFVALTVAPVLAIVVMFSYAFFHIRDSVKFTSHEITGLRVIAQIERTVFNIQKLRGLICTEDADEKSTEYIKNIKEDISKDLAILKEYSAFIENDTSFKNEILKYIDSLGNPYLLEYTNYYYLTEVIHDFMKFSNRLSYHCKLVLDPNMNSYVLIDNVVFLLPELIEYNGQIRAVTSSTQNSVLVTNQREYIGTQENKIKEKLEKLNYNLSRYYENRDSDKIKEVHNGALKAQDAIIGLANNKFLSGENLSYEASEIYNIATKNIEFIIDLYNENLKNLNDILEKRLNKDREISIFIILAGFCSILFIIFINVLFYRRNRKFINKIEELTITDAMTTLHNRRYFDLVFDNLLKAQKRARQTLAFVIVDIDNFKQYNDTYGHQAGDEALKAVANCLKNSLKREGDFAFRLGGEEFGVLCTGLDDSQAFDFADGIRKKVEEEKIEHKKSTASKYVTISMGLIVIKPELINSVNDVYRCADEALYRAKENGRNKVVVYNEMQ